jgi:hypothetical protein
MQQHKVVAAVFRPRGFVVAGVHRLVLAVADGADARRVNAILGQRLARGQRAAFAERAVVFLRAAFVAIALDEQLRVRSDFNAAATDSRFWPARWI